MQCLVTKLKESATNDNLLKLGEIAIKFKKIGNNNADKHKMVFSSKNQVQLKIRGDGYFTDQNMIENQGTTLDGPTTTEIKTIYISDSDCEVIISNKHELTYLYVNSEAICSSLIDISWMQELKYLSLNNSNITGPIKHLSTFKKLEGLYLENTKTYGDLKDLAQLSRLTTITISGGDITGNVESLSGLTKLKDIKLKYINVHGDLSCLSDQLYFFSNFGGEGLFSWETERKEDANIIAMEKVKLGDDVDKMLINQAKCKIGYTDSGNIWNKTIQVYGNRTSASNKAVETLKSKGYTIIVNDVTL